MDGWKYGGAGQIGQGSPWVLQGYHTYVFDAQMPLYINFVDMAYMYVYVSNSSIPSAREVSDLKVKGA